MLHRGHQQGPDAQNAQTAEHEALPNFSACKLLPKAEQAVRLTIEVELATVAEKFSALGHSGIPNLFVWWRKNFHVPGGNSVIIGKLGEALKGPKIMGATVTHVSRHQENGLLVAEVRYLKNSTEQKIQADAVVMALPWVMLHQIQFEPAPY